MAEGNSKLIMKNGEKYEGEYLRGRKHGFGIYTNSHKDVYEGNFEMGLIQGKGSL